MSTTHAYWVPDYYEHFVCKGPTCRSSCCHGWGISLSLKEYYRLLGLPCKKNLRRRLDGAFHLADHPDAERYALITPKYDGDCPLHLENGYCALHKECGETSLAAICRYYPRSAKIASVPECSCANSCEAVLELLFQETGTLGFREQTLTFDLPEEETKGHAHIQPFYHEIRVHCISILQNRAHSLPDRMVELGHTLHALHAVYESGDTQAIQAVLDDNAPKHQMDSDSLPKADEMFSLPLQQRLVCFFDEISSNLRTYGEAAQTYFGIGNAPDIAEDTLPGAAKRYSEGCIQMTQNFPDWERLFEHMLVNHVFFSCFPFSDRTEDLWDEYVSLCAVYALLRFLVVGALFGENSMGKLVDMAAAAFRLIDHSHFDRNAASLFRAVDCYSLEKLAVLLRA